MISGKFYVNINKCYAALLFVWRPDSGCCEHWFNPMVTLPLRQHTCQHVLLLACSFIWKNVVMPELQIDPPGRALSSPSLYPGEAAGEARVGRNAGGRMKTDWAQLLAHLPTPLPLPSFSPFGFLLFSTDVCCRTNVHEVTHCHMHTPEHT